MACVIPTIECEVVVGDYGTIIRLTAKDGAVVVNISTATAMTIVLKHVTKTVTLTATFFTDGTDGIMEATTVSGDISVRGEWIIRGHLTLGGWTGYTSKARLLVEDP